MPQKKPRPPIVLELHKIKITEPEMMRIIHGGYFALHYEKGYQNAWSWREKDGARTPSLLPGGTTYFDPADPKGLKGWFVTKDLNFVFEYAFYSAKTRAERVELIDDFDEHYGEYRKYSPWYRAVSRRAEVIRRRAAPLLSRGAVAQVRSRKVRKSFPTRAGWLRRELDARQWNVHNLQANNGPHWKTGRKILDGHPVRETVLEKVALALSVKKHVSVAVIPNS